LKQESRREALAIAVAISPFAVLAALGALFDLRILGGVLIFLAPAALGAACCVLFALRFRHVDRDRVPHLIDLPTRLVLTRVLLPLAALVIFCALVVLVDPGGKLPPGVLAFGAAGAFVWWVVTNLLWRRWAKSLGFDPDDVLVAMHHQRAYPQLEEAERRRTGRPPAV
jgi:hypothetical protein